MCLTTDRSDVQAYLGALQDIIARMRQHSASCKAWCITLTSAVVVLGVNKSKPALFAAAFPPLVMFLLLDCYYLSIERFFRRKYDGFVERLHAGQAGTGELYVMKHDVPIGKQLRGIVGSLFSLSTFPFYAVLAGVLVLAMRLVADGG